MSNNKMFQRIVSLIGTGAMMINIAGCSFRQNSDKSEIPSSPVASDSLTEKTKAVKYTVKYGDTLLSIAEYFCVPVNQIMEENNIVNMDKIYVDDILVISNVRESIADKYYDSIAPRVNIEYTVASGDNLETIANKFGISVTDIIETNNIVNANKIYAGSVLILENVLLSKVEEVNGSYLVDYEDDAQHSNLPDGFIRGIDVSSWNGEIDWNIIAKLYYDGTISFVVLRMAENWSDGRYQFTLDSQFERNLSECNKRGIPYGVYVFSRGYNEEMIKEETTAVIDYINNNLNTLKDTERETLDLIFRPLLPIYMDCFERSANNQYAIYKNKNYDYCEKLIKLWCDEIENAGYFTGVYCSGNFYKAMGEDRLSDYSLWIAHYGNAVITDKVENIVLNGRVDFNGVVKSQQITEAGIIDGMDSKFDVNIADEDLLKIVGAYYRNKPNTRHLG